MQRAASVAVATLGTQPLCRQGNEFTPQELSLLGLTHHAQRPDLGDISDQTPLVRI